ncbi:MAG: GNAT family N-acetyltransferase [Pseudomonadales bacterium]
MSYEFRSPRTDEDWRAYHDIRRAELWEARGQFGVYDDQHPDEAKPNHHPKLLYVDGVPIGVVRIDIEGEIAWFRRVAIVEAYQRKGHGRAMLTLAESFARAAGAKRVESSIDLDAISFYRNCGYRAHEGQPETAVYKLL